AHVVGSVPMVVRLLPVFFPVVAVVVIAGVHVRTRGDAVLAAVGTGGQAEVAAFAQPGQADAAGAGLHRAVGQAAGAGIVAFLVASLVALVVVSGMGRAGDVVVVGVAQQAVDVQHQVVAADAIESEHAAALVVDRVAAQFGATGQRRIRHLAGDAAVDHVDRAAD